VGRRSELKEGPPTLSAKKPGPPLPFQKIYYQVENQPKIAKKTRENCEKSLKRAQMALNGFFSDFYLFLRRLSLKSTQNAVNIHFFFLPGLKKWKPPPP
jgi:hypothetical protein